MLKLRVTVRQNLGSKENPKIVKKIILNPETKIKLILDLSSSEICETLWATL